MYKRLLYFFFLILSFQLKAQTWTWVEERTCESYYPKITFAPDGGFYLYGTFLDSVLFDNNYLYADSGSYEMFIVRYDIDKNILWSKSFGGSYLDAHNRIDQLNGLKIDRNSNLVFAGSFAKQFVFGNDTINSINDWQDAFIASCDSMGNPLWIKHLHGRAAEGAQALFLDDDDNMYLGCAYVDFDLIDTLILEQNHVALDSVILPYRGIIDNCLLKINGNGRIEWVKAWGGKGNDFTNGISFDTYGMIYVSMKFDSTLFFDSDSVVSRGGSDQLVLKYDTSGHFIWKMQIGNIKSDGFPIHFSNERYNYIYGRIDSITTIAGVDILGTSINSSCFIAKIDSAGRYIDSKVFSSTGYYSEINHLVLDEGGNIYFIANVNGGNMQLDTLTLRGEGPLNLKTAIAKADLNLKVLKLITAVDFGRAKFYSFHKIPSGLLVFGNTDTTLILGADTLGTDTSCQSLFIAQLDFTISIDELSNLSSLSLYPNPATEKAELLITLNRPSKASINIYSMQGVLVLSQKSGLLLNGSNRVTIDLGSENISKGIYICTVHTGNEKRAIKLVVQ